MRTGESEDVVFVVYYRQMFENYKFDLVTTRLKTAEKRARELAKLCLLRNDVMSFVLVEQRVRNVPCWRKYVSNGIGGHIETKVTGEFYENKGRAK